ncbi:MAG: serine/threonine-protein kinase [Myxococcota bacterium]
MTALLRAPLAAVTVPADIEKLHAHWEQAGINPDALIARSDGTLMPPQTERSDPRLIATLPSDEVELPGRPSGIVARLDTDEVVLGSILGEGGMGRVWLGSQRSLARDVAVKGVREDLDGPIGRAQLLREARVTGALEHPNIIPVHAIVEGSKGEPLMVMKRVEGTSWADRIADTLGNEDHLETHLRVLMQVCHAVHFAHTRGVLHRDLKPDNVMLGEFGEVYVVDWGLAVALREDAQLTGLPLYDEVKGIVGTIQYMAPEMVEGHGRGLCVQSDVYLLGSMLHEILTGNPPHLGDAVPQILHAAWRSMPFAYDPSIPEELVALAHLAMHKEASERPASAEAFRELLDDFLRHKSSADLTEEAQRRLVRAREKVAEGVDPTTALREARFGFLQALRIWPENQPAKTGLHTVLGVLIEHALAGEHLDSARKLLGEMDTAQRLVWRDEVSALTSRIESRDAKMLHLEREAHEADLSQSSKPRRVFGVGFALAFFLVNVALDLWDRGHGVDWWLYLIATAATAFVFFVPILIFYRRLFPNRAARRLSVTLGLLLAGQGITFTGMSVVGLDLHAALALSLFPLASMIAGMSALLDPRMWWSALLAAVCGVVGVFVPGVVFYGVAVAYSAFFIGGALLDYQAR